MTPAALKAALAGDLLNALVAMTPGGIEQQEAQGQAALVASEELPKEIRGATREQLAALGFVFGADVDDLFVECKLPPGWTKRASNHSMHSDLLDDKGRTRAGIFYKAAFYDRRADMSFTARFYVNSHHETATKDTFKVVVADGGAAVYTAGEWTRPNYEASDALEQAARAWLTEKYPDHRNPLAYWD